MDEDSWENVSFVEYDEREKKTLKHKYFINIHKLLYIYKIIKETLPINNNFISIQASDFNRYKLIQSLVKENNPLLKNIIIFLTMINYNMQARICFILENSITSFIQTEFSSIQAIKKKYDYEVIGLNHFFDLTDLTYLYSKKNSFKITDGIKECFYKLFTNKFDSPRIRNNCFIEMDNNFLNKIPNSVNKLKKHPFYVIESILHPSFIIWPKRNVVGYFKGEKVFLKKDIKKLLTENQWRIQGKKLKDDIPYRIHNDKKLYAYWQVEDVCIKTFSDKMIMDYFHPNFLPLDSFYSKNEYSEEVALYLNLDYRKAMTGFLNRMPFIKGIFIKKSHENIFNETLNEFIFYKNIELNHEKNVRIFSTWDMFVKKAKRFLEIKKSIG